MKKTSRDGINVPARTAQRGLVRTPKKPHPEKREIRRLGAGVLRFKFNAMLRRSIDVPVEINAAGIGLIFEILSLERKYRAK